MTTTAPYTLIDPLLSDSEAAELLDLFERFGSYGMYSEEGLNEGIGEGLPQRFDAAYNFINTGGRFGKHEDLELLVARTNYFRETYSYGDDVQAPGVEVMRDHPALAEAARKLYGRDLIVPAIVYANVLVPGQELAVHTDVPEFRGVSRKNTSQWLLVVMHHSGLFEQWRMPIATAVAWFQHAEGGEFAFYPRGAQGGPSTVPAAFNTALVTDTDSVFHGVDRVRQSTGDMPLLKPGMRMVSDGPGTGRWRVVDDDGELAAWNFDEIRLSVSWKAYCFADQAEREAWEQGRDDLGVDFILDRLLDDLRSRGRVKGDRPESNRELAEMLVDEYIKFPPAEQAAA
jgi:hypothetical protein